MQLCMVWAFFWSSWPSRQTCRELTSHVLLQHAQAEMQRLASQAAIGPAWILDLGHGKLIRPEGDSQGSAAAGSAQGSSTGLAPAASQVETMCTALRVLLVDKGYSIRALSTMLASAAALPLASVEAQQRSAQVWGMLMIIRSLGHPEVRPGAPMQNCSHSCHNLQW